MQTAAAIPARFDRSAQHRRSMIAKINIARQQLNMDEDDYRQGLFDATGCLSLKGCSEPQLEKMLSWLKSKGFRALQKKSGARHPMALKARAMWISLYQLGTVHNAAEEALEAFAKRQIGCERLVWARQSDAYRLIEALKSMARRAGWMMHNPVTGKMFGPIELKSSLCSAILIKLKEADAIPQDWALHDAAWRLCGIENLRERGWTAGDYEKLADGLGAKLRQFSALAGGARS